MVRHRVLLSLIAALLVGTSAAADEPYPTRPITVVNPFPPGGLSDVITRPLAAVMEPVLKQPVVILNKGGAAGAVGAQYVATAKSDGYRLLSHIVSISVVPEVDTLFGRPPKYTRDHFVPIARLNADAPVLIVGADTPWKTLQDLVDDAKKRPDEIIFSSSGPHGAPRGTPDAAVKAVRGAVRQGVQHPDFRKAMDNAGLVIAYQDGPELKAWWDRDAAAIASTVKAIGKIEGQ